MDRHGLTNVRLERADIRDLPLENESFDAVLVHAVLEHLEDPVAAMREVRRVLKVGGVVGVRSPDYGNGVVLHPADPLLEQAVALHTRFKVAAGSARMGRALRAVLRDAGFADISGSASMEYYASPEQTRTIAHTWAQLLSGRRFLGVADPARLEAMASAWRAWGEHPDAFYATPWGEAVGWIK
jgi:SAM-dependent methyltransferase